MCCFLFLEKPHADALIRWGERRELLRRWEEVAHRDTFERRNMRFTTRKNFDLSIAGAYRTTDQYTHKFLFNCMRL